MATGRVWNQVPGAVYWGTLPPQTSTLSIGQTTGQGAKSASMPSKSRNLSLNFYDFAAETEEDEKDLHTWIKEDPNRGAIRVYQPGSTYSELTRCDTETYAEVIMSRCVTSDLYVYYAGQFSEPLGYDDRPLEIQNRFLRSLGYEEPERIQFEGTREDLVYMFKFVAGREENKADERVQLTCTVKFKESSPFSFWSKRFCVLCGCQLHIFSSSTPKGKPSLTLDLAGGIIIEHETKKHLYCLQIETAKKTILLSFESRYDQSVWLKRAAKVVTKHPLEANLTRCSLNRLPKYIFLNKNLAALNMSHNFMLEVVENSVTGQPEGWINDIYRFSNLKILSLSDNNLVHFPVSVCNIVTLSELDLSCNKIKVIPSDIQKLKGLTTLLLHSNLISTLPYHLHDLHRLTTLVIAFNRFKTVPHIVKELESLRILIAAGNNITSIPEDINRIQTLQILDVRMNCISSHLPTGLSELPIFFSLNIRGNQVTEFDMRRARNLHVINCSDNSIRSLSLHKGKTGIINARNNCIGKLTIASNPLSLTTLDLSKNELTMLPESLAQLMNLEKLTLSHNRLVSLPKNIMRTLQKLKVLHVSNNNIISLPEIGESCSVESLDVHSNKLTELPSNLFQSCNSLKQLNISNNPITTLPFTGMNKKQTHQYVLLSHHCHPLTELRACDCSLTVSSVTQIVNLKKLKLLHMAYNTLKTIPPEIFSSLPELEYLNLSSNQLHNFRKPPHSCPRLVALILHTNNITEWPEFPSMPAVETLDLSCNELTKMPKLYNFRRLKSLNLSHNKDIEINPKELDHLRFLQFFGLEGIKESVAQEVKKSFGDCVEISTPFSHDLWTHGSSCIRGTNLTKTADYCMQQLKLGSFNDKRDREGLFAMIDGGKAPDASVKIKKKIAAIIHSELLACEERKISREKPLLYLEHSFLTMHRKLGPIGLKYGASMVMIHLRDDPKKGGLVLNAANTGLGEAMLCHGTSSLTPLTLSHNPATNRAEMERVAKEKGFISEDDRVNGVCGVSRLLGCYYLHPQIIPLPHTKSLSPLPSNSSYIILGSHGLWKFLTHKEIAKMTRGNLNPNLHARHLADMAIGCGCPLDVSVIVIKLKVSKSSYTAPKLGVDKHVGSSHKRISTLSGNEDLVFVEQEYESDEEEEEEDEEITNIDDIMEEAFNDDDMVTMATENLDTEALRAISPDQLDALVLGAPPNQVKEMPIIVADSNSSRDSLIIQNSLIDVGEEEEEEEEEEVTVLAKDVEVINTLPMSTLNGDHDNDDRRLSAISGQMQYNITQEDVTTDIFDNIDQDMSDLPMLHDDDYKPKTFPRKTSRDRASVYPTRIQLNLESSYEQTQSAPLRSSDNEGDDEDTSSDDSLTADQRRLSAPNPAILQVNRAISQINSTQRKAIQNASKVARKKSFVESSYSRLSRHLVASDSNLVIN